MWNYLTFFKFNVYVDRFAMKLNIRGMWRGVVLKTNRRDCPCGMRQHLFVKNVAQGIEIKCPSLGRSSREGN